jgi:hypothetical protein
MEITSLIPALRATCRNWSWRCCRRTTKDAASRIFDFKAAGTKLIWIVDPLLKIVQTHHRKRGNYVITESDVMQGFDVLPGFSLKLEDVLPKPRKRKAKGDRKQG